MLIVSHTIATMFIIGKKTNAAVLFKDIGAITVKC